MSRRFVVTGATGLIGRRVVGLLVERGHLVTGYDRVLDSRLNLIPRTSASLSSGSRVTRGIWRT